jgi:hypothetical protein
MTSPGAGAVVHQVRDPGFPSEQLAGEHGPTGHAETVA